MEVELQVQNLVVLYLDKLIKLFVHLSHQKNMAKTVLIMI